MLKLLTLVAFSFTLARADNITTGTTCTVFTTVTDPNSCSLTQSIGPWSSTAEGSIGVETYGDGAGPGYSAYALATDAGPYGEDGLVEGTANITVAFAGSYAVEVTALAMGGDGGFSDVDVQLGDQSWAIGNYQGLGFSLNTTPGEVLSASVLTDGEGYASLLITEGEADPAPVPEPGTLLLAAAVMAVFFARSLLALFSRRRSHSQ
jgi:hypothetical protein